MINLTKEIIEDQIKLYHTGYKDLEADFHFGPIIRDHYLINFVIKGKGQLRLDGVTYDLSRNQAFLCRPGETIELITNTSNPWSYYWIGFHGKDIPQVLEKTGFKDQAVITFNSDDILYSILAKLQDLNPLNFSHELKQTAYLFEILARIAELNTNDSESKSRYANLAIEYIQKNYSLGITIQDVADYLNLNRSYFSRVFKATYDISAHEYLINYRIHKAKYLLIKSDIKVSEVAYSVGYSDSYTFSKAFKKIEGVNPLTYRKNNRNLS